MSSDNPSAGDPLKVAFEPATRMLMLDRLCVDRPPAPAVFNCKKFLQVVASIATVGLVEPLVVIPSSDGAFRVLDGRLRLEALRRLGKGEALCLVATDDESYTYNKHINALTTAQDARMLAQAIAHGVSKERIAAVLGVDTETVRRRSTLLAGICPEAAARLADKMCPAATFSALKHMQPMRQLEAVDLMCGQGNFSSTFARAILSATPAAQLIEMPRALPSKPKDFSTQLARMERELLRLQTQAGGQQAAYGTEHLHLAVACSYVASVMRNATVVTWLRARYPDHATQLQRIANDAETTRQPRRAMKLPFKRKTPPKEEAPV